MKKTFYWRFSGNGSFFAVFLIFCRFFQKKRQKKNGNQKKRQKKTAKFKISQKNGKLKNGKNQVDKKKRQKKTETENGK